MHKASNGKLPPNLSKLFQKKVSMHSYRLRNIHENQLYCRTAKTTACYKSIVIAGVELRNSTDPDLKTLGFTDFSKKYKQEIINS